MYNNLQYNTDIDQSFWDAFNDGHGNKNEAEVDIHVCLVYHR